MRFCVAILLFAMMMGPAFAAPLSYPACSKPDLSFKSFLDRFTNNLEFQRSRLSLPLVARAGDGVTANATVELWEIKQIRTLKEPLIYSDAGRRKLHISQSVDFVREAPSVAEVWQAEEAESDAIKLQYWFRKRGGCWYLAEFDDWGS